MANPAQLSEALWVCGQIEPGQVAELSARLGLQRIINNRPDHEEPGQPASDDLRAAAEAAGIEYLSLPVSGLPAPQTVQAVGAALAEGRPTLMFCRSGMRSTAAWALAQHAGGADPDALRAQAAAAGYDLSRLPL